MNEIIINNLYEFWEHIGILTGSIIKEKNYSAVSALDSDWPNRIFQVKHISALKEVVSDSNMPKLLTDGASLDLESNPNLKLYFTQKNMALDLDIFESDLSPDQNIIEVSSEEEADQFAETASLSFGYNVVSSVTKDILKKSKSIKMFLYKEESKVMGCGIIFYDSDDNAGLHMIGTIPAGRGKGIGKSMTEALLLEAKKAGSEYCVLHASAMGEPIYRKLGFQSYDNLNTYQIIE